MCARDLNLSDLREAPTITQRAAKSHRPNDAFVSALPLARSPKTSLQLKINSIGVVSHRTVAFNDQPFVMGPNRSNADIVTKSAPQAARALAARDGSFDPALASLFASSVRG
jgi:hypothetical protein